MGSFDVYFAEKRESYPQSPVNGRRVSRKRFIRTGVVLGVGTVGIPLLAGCGDGRASRSPEAPASPYSPDREVAPGEAIASEEEVEPDSAVLYANTETGQPEVLVRLPDGEFVAYSAVCTHQGCTVAYRRQMQKLACPCHGGVFDPAEGAAVVSGPPRRPLPEVEIELRDGKVFRA